MSNTFTQIQVANIEHDATNPDDGVYAQINDLDIDNRVENQRPRTKKLK